MLMTDLQRLSDEQLVAEIAALNGGEQRATAALVAHLAELEARSLHHAMGFRSLYAYCRGVLHLSEYESYNRMEAAHVVRRFPVIVPMIAEGLLHLTAVRLLAPRLGDENHLALLGGAIHRSKVEVKQLLARWFPEADVPTSIRRAVTPTPSMTSAGSPSVPVEPSVSGDAATTARSSPTDGTAGSGMSIGGTEGPASLTPVTVAAPRKATIDPLSADTYSVRLTARSATIERLRRAQEILSHAVPDGNVDEILYRALGALIENESRKKLATGGPRRGRLRPAPPASRGSGPAGRPSRTISATTEREVRTRDGDQCAFVAKDGRRCAERRFLELHHLKPWIAGGGGTAGNVSLRCRAHNRFEWNVFIAPIRAAQDGMATRSGPS